MPYGKNYNREKKAAADKRYREKNKEKNQYSVGKSMTKNFILKRCTKEDLLVVQEWIKEREVELK